MEVFGSKLIFLQVDGSQWNIDVFGSKLKFLEVNGNRWKSKEVDGSILRLMEGCGSK